MDKTTAQQSQDQQFETDSRRREFSVNIPWPHNSSESYKIIFWTQGSAVWVHLVPGSAGSSDSRDTWYLKLQCVCMYCLQHYCCWIQHYHGTGSSDFIIEGAETIDSTEAMGHFNLSRDSALTLLKWASWSAVKKLDYQTYNWRFLLLDIAFRRGVQMFKKSFPPKNLEYFLIC